MCVIRPLIRESACISFPQPGPPSMAEHDLNIEGEVVQSNMLCPYHRFDSGMRGSVTITRARQSFTSTPQPCAAYMHGDHVVCRFKEYDREGQHGSKWPRRDPYGARRTTPAAERTSVTPAGARLTSTTRRTTSLSGTPCTGPNGIVSVPLSARDRVRSVHIPSRHRRVKVGR